MPHELWNINNNIMTNITPLVGSISWKSNTTELGERLDFDVAYNDARYFPINPVDIGNLLVLKNRSEIFRGIAIAEQRQGRGPIVYNVFDYAFYLNKSKEIYQFNRVSGKKVIEKICKDFNIPVGNIADISTVINKIYIDKFLSVIIRDVLEIAENETGIKYRMEMRNGKFVVEEQKNLILKATFKLADNVAENNVMEAIGNPTRRRSIEEMKNSIKITSDDKLVITVKNDSLIKQYGLLQEVASVDKKDIAQARNIAKNMLKDLGKIFEENSIELPGNDDARAGRIVEIEEPITGMIGQYILEDVFHIVKNGIHRMTLGLGVL